MAVLLIPDLLYSLILFKREPRKSSHFCRSLVLLSPDFDKIDNTCGFSVCLSCSPIGKRTHVLLAFSHTYILLASDFHELWHRVMTISLLTEVKWQWAMLVLGWVTVSVQDQLWDVSKLEFLSVSRLS